MFEDLVCRGLAKLGRKNGASAEVGGEVRAFPVGGRRLWRSDRLTLRKPAAAFLRTRASFKERNFDIEIGKIANTEELLRSKDWSS
jgi:hypothetical protein